MLAFLSLDKILDIYSLKEKRFNLLMVSVHDTSWQKDVAEKSCLVHGGQKADQEKNTSEERAGDQTRPRLQGHTSVTTRRTQNYASPVIEQIPKAVRLTPWKESRKVRKSR